MELAEGFEPPSEPTKGDTSMPTSVAPKHTHFRTLDTTYGEEYWATLDGGAGYHQSCMWRDIAHIVAETWLIDHEAAKDRSGECQHVDVGCAMGFLVQAMRERGVESWGLDFSKYALEHAPDDVFPYLRQFDLRSPDPSFFGTNKFSLVTCIETLEHVDEQFVERALTHLLQLLEPGGQLLATICVEGQPGWDTDPTHVTIKPAWWWGQRLQDAGFVLDHKRVELVKRWWLFSHHRGVFCAARPPDVELSSDRQTAVS
jgi:SAM-dependent methyltransferase